MTEPSEEDKEKQANSDLTEDDYAISILKNRLAKGDITAEEFDVLKQRLVGSSDKLEDKLEEVNKELNSMKEDQRIKDSKKFQEKSEGTAVVLALIPGLVGLSGIGHMYSKNGLTGVLIMIVGLLIFGAAIWLRAYSSIGIIWGAVFFVYYIFFIWQVIDAKKQCRNYNSSLYEKKDKN